MQPATRVLLIEDDRKLSRLLAEYLRSQGLTAEAVHDGLDGAARATAEPWALIVLDVMLPRLDGFEVLRRIRAVSDVPVLMLTARGGEDDRVFGLEHGADDYLPKTASSRELLARIRALLRRAALVATGAGSASDEREIRVGGLRMDAAARAAQLDGRALELTPVEFDLLLALARSRGRACSRDTLLDRLRDREFDGLDRSIDMHVAALRRKLGDDPKQPRYIRTVRTVGYLLVDPAGE
ncbi:response regulator transcription factor [Hydrocarboniphaga sp.]|uniref:response regulator transcription factor n=1 Tax=Hydrocarboniphaga sp. TaxID=2033016 RepID=UPI002618CD00|nr:response regulator transcription factor [Hydrocarboniphaga sp.]